MPIVPYRPLAPGEVFDHIITVEEFAAHGLITDEEHHPTKVEVDAGIAWLKQRLLACDISDRGGPPCPCRTTI